VEVGRVRKEGESGGREGKETGRDKEEKKKE
jgi:hypothetical protein